MDLTEPVFAGTPEAARALAAVLEGRGIACFVEDHHRFSAHAGTRVPTFATLFVAEGDVERARAAHADWVAGSERRVGQTLRRVASVVMLAPLPALLWVVAAFAAPAAVPSPTMPGLALVGLLSLIVVGQLEDRRHRRERLPMPPGTHPLPTTSDDSSRRDAADGAGLTSRATGRHTGRIHVFAGPVRRLCPRAWRFDPDRWQEREAAHGRVHHRSRSVLLVRLLRPVRSRARADLLRLRRSEARPDRSRRHRADPLLVAVGRRAVGRGGCEMTRTDRPITTLPNIGATIARRLNAVGVHSRGDLAKVGPATVFNRVRAQYPDETISVCYYLYSLEGALRGCHWDDVDPKRKAELRREAGIE